jgi:hypothetical protein
MELVLGDLHGRNTTDTLEAYSDSDFAGYTDTYCCVAGMAVFYTVSPLLWRSVKMPTIVKSATSGEYVAASMASDEIVFCMNFLMEFGFSLPATVLHVDNSAAMNILESGKVVLKTKYLAVHWHSVRERHEEDIIQVEWVATDDGIAGLFTKTLGPQKLRKFSDEMGLRSA